LQNGKVKFRGTPNFQKGFEDKFSKDNEGSWILEISSGTIEMKDNKVIVLAD
jgi:F-type H+-transporting ATPase subunit epsilon